jgi:branched-subunit amino acid transport protein
MENEMREDIKKALKFVEYAVFSALIIGLVLGGVIGGLTVFALMR